MHLSHPELLQESVRFAPVDTDSGHSLTHRAACLIPDSRALRVDAGTLGLDAYWPVHGARARTGCTAWIVNLSDAVYEAMVVDAPLPAVVPKLVVQIGFGGVLRRHHELHNAPRLVQLRWWGRQQGIDRDKEEAERATHHG